MTIEVRPATLPQDLGIVRELFREYSQALGIDLCFQGFEAELAQLPGKYAAPSGRIMLAWDGGKAVACVAMRPVDAISCEMKRLYVRPEMRKLRLGRRMVDCILAEAKQAGYRRICLDTMPSMGAAIGLYTDLGFSQIEPYVFNPVEGALFLGREL
jgi:ribosomal protein S18 acetylase RimI-like enzyme